MSSGRSYFGVRWLCHRFYGFNSTTQLTFSPNFKKGYSAPPNSQQILRLIQKLRHSSVRPNRPTHTPGKGKRIRVEVHFPDKIPVQAVHTRLRARGTYRDIPAIEFSRRRAIPPC